MRRGASAAGFLTLGLCGVLMVYACTLPKAPNAAKEGAETLVKDVSYPEGAAYFNGQLYYVGFGDDTVNFWDGNKGRLLKKLDRDSGPCAVVPVGKDELLVACYTKNTLVRLDKDGNTLATIKADLGPNDFTRDADGGGVYFSTSGVFEEGTKTEGKVYHLDPSGKAACVATDIHYANGLALADEGKSLLVAETLEGQVLKFKVGDGGALSGRTVWKRLDDTDVPPHAEGKHWYIGPDGLKADTKGNVYICQFGAGRALVMDKDGKWLRTLSVPYKYVTNVALSPDERVAYVTAAQDAWNAPFGGAVFQIPNH